MTSALDEMNITERIRKEKVDVMVELASLCAFAVPKGTGLQEINGYKSHDSLVKVNYFI